MVKFLHVEINMVVNRPIVIHDSVNMTHVNASLYHYLSKRIELRFVLLLLLLLLLCGKFAHFFQIAIAQPIFELGPSDFVW